MEFRVLRDPYDTGLSSGWFGESSARHEASRARDSQLGMLERQLEAPRAEASTPTRPEGWELERRRRWREFDFAALDAALERLRQVDEGACRALHGRWIYGWQTGSSPLLEARCERGLRFLDAVLPVPLRAPPAVGERPPLLAVRGDRDREIRRLIREGAAAQWVAREFGLSVSQVNRICRGT